MNDIPEETELILKSQQCNEAAFSELMRRYRRKVLTLCTQIINDRGIAEDVVQETFISAYRHLKSFKMNARFYTWLYRIAVNLSINAIRKQQSQKAKTTLTDFAYTTESGRNLLETQHLPSEELELQEIHDLIEEGLRTLTHQQSEVIRLYDLEGLSHQEIATRLKIRAGTVRSRLHYARRKMRRFLSGRMDNGPEWTWCVLLH